MELKDLIGAAINVAAVLVAVAAYIISRQSRRHAEDAMRTTANQYAAELSLKADQQFVDYPQLRPYFFDDREPPAASRNAKSEEKRLRIEAIAEFHLDVMEAIMDHRDRFVGTDIEAWREWMHDLMETSPALRDFYGEDGHLWYPSFTRMIEDGVCRSPGDHLWTLSKLEQRKPDLAASLAARQSASERETQESRNAVDELASEGPAAN